MLCEWFCFVALQIKFSRMLQRKIELLAPAKDLETGIAAINYGADAVYIGGPRFGARQAASNSLSAIEQLVRHAHLFGAKVYVTINTLLFDNELLEAEKLANDLWSIGVDALIVQDMAFAEMNLKIPLHASTQTNNMTPEKVCFFEQIGFDRVVLGRELSLGQVENIHKETAVELEYFVHGALCVGQSGQCYMSHVVGGRSANRGACAQPCRLPWSLYDTKGNLLIENKHLLSLKDMNHSVYLEQLIDAGVSSLKIEGRLKDIAYVKNITAYYRAKLDSIFERRSDLLKASYGTGNPAFEPNPEKTFSRGFSNYFLFGKQNKIDNPHTPKSMGEHLGKVIEIRSNTFSIQTEKMIHNGDGLCFLDKKMQLQGMNVNGVNEKQITPNRIDGIFVGADLYRNYDHEWNKKVEHSKGERKIAIKLVLSANSKGYALEATAEQGVSEKVSMSVEKIKADNLEKSRETIRKKALQWGDTPFRVSMFETNFDTDYFIPTSVIGTLKQQLATKLKETIIQTENTSRKANKVERNKYPYPEKTLDFRGNVTNRKAREFYQNHGVTEIENGLELEIPNRNITVMTTKFCLRFAHGLCPKQTQQKAEPLLIRNGKNTFQLTFDCARCQVNILKTDV